MPDITDFMGFALQASLSSDGLETEHFCGGIRKIHTVG
jgi:hypothetical protein